MKTRTLISVLILIMAVFVLLAGGSKKEEYYGTWVNTDYDRTVHRLGKYIHNRDGTLIKYMSTSDTEPYKTATFTIEDKWTDSEGNIWYKILYTRTEQIISYFELTKISDSGTTLELVFSIIDYPTEIDLNAYGYRIYYRQQNVLIYKAR